MQASHTQSRKWVNPVVKTRDELKRLNNAQRKFCKESPFFHLDFDLAQHRKDMAADHHEQLRRQAESLAKQISDHGRCRDLDHHNSFLLTSIKSPFNGKRYRDNRAAVLALETVFTPSYALDRHIRHGSFIIAAKEVSDWPSKAEAKYEGDERISTDRIHGRFLGVPRTAGNETVNWMQKSVVPPYALDDFTPPPSHLWPASWEVEIFLRMHVVKELEVGPISDEGAVLVSRSLMYELEH